MLALLSLCYMVVGNEQQMPYKKEDSIISICAASAAYLAFHGRTKYLTQRSIPVPTSIPCSLFFGTAGLVGLDTYNG